MGIVVVVSADRKLVNQWGSDHCHTLAGGTPILALDMYEHSYHIDFGAKAGSYVDAFIGALRWDNADRLFRELTNGASWVVRSGMVDR
jgi:superoxide dismutase, Fe-Mn family